MSTMRWSYLLVLSLAAGGLTPWLAGVFGQPPVSVSGPPAGTIRAEVPPGLPAAGANVRRGVELRFSGGPEDELRQQEDKAAGQVRRLLGQYREAAADADKEKLKKNLVEAIETQFGLQQKRRDQEIKQVEARVKRLRDLLEKREAQKRRIVDSRVDQLLREAEGLGWTAPGEEGHGSFSAGPRQINVFGPPLEPGDSPNPLGGFNTGVGDAAPVTGSLRTE